MYLIFLISLIKSLIFFFWVIMLSSALLYFFTAYCIYFFSISGFFFIINMRSSSSSLLMIFDAHFTCCVSVKTVPSFRISVLFWYFSSDVLNLHPQSHFSVSIMESQAICQCDIFWFNVLYLCQQLLLTVSSFSFQPSCQV